MNGRTKFVVAWMTLLYFMSWFMSLAHLIGIRFWDDKYALDHTLQHRHEAILYNSTAISDVGASYYSPRRYIYMLPHVLGAIFWWNLYFFSSFRVFETNTEAFIECLVDV